jgi:hypothetical protein
MAFGSGALISERHILTCAHNCYINKNADVIYFYPANNGKKGIGYKVKDIKYL